MVVTLQRGPQRPLQHASDCTMRRAFLIFVVPVGLVLAGCQTTPKAKVNVGYYQVSGTSEKTIERQLALHGPYIPGKGRALAAAKIAIEQRVQVAEADDWCRVTDARITVRADITLPKWRQRRTASPELGRKWDIFAAYAKAHEEVHVRIAEQYAAELERKLEAIPVQTDCKKVSKLVSAVSNDVVDRMNEAQDQFDRDEQKRLRAISS